MMVGIRVRFGREDDGDVDFRVFFLEKMMEVGKIIHIIFSSVPKSEAREMQF